MLAIEPNKYYNERVVFRVFTNLSDRRGNATETLNGLLIRCCHVPFYDLEMSSIIVEGVITFHLPEMGNMKEDYD